MDGAEAGKGIAIISSTGQQAGAAPRECLLIAVDPLLEVSLAIWRKISRIEAIKRQLDSLLPPFGIYHSLGGVETRGARKFVDRERCTIWGDLV